MAHDRVVVAAYGNPLRGDDGVGWRVAEALAIRWGPRLRVLTAHHPLPEWAPTLASARSAFFVDASVDSARVRVQRIALRPDTSLLDGHALNAAGLLGLTQRLYSRSPETYLVHIPVERLDFDERLSPRATAAAQRAVKLLNQRLAVLLAPHQCS